MSKWVNETRLGSVDGEVRERPNDEDKSFSATDFKQYCHLVGIIYYWNAQGNVYCVRYTFYTSASALLWSANILFRYIGMVCSSSRINSATLSMYIGVRYIQWRHGWEFSRQMSQTKNRRVGGYCLTVQLSFVMRNDMTCGCTQLHFS